ncbi:MAG TPA: DUF1330 domain-containing protein [Candidatus Omnitrophota bacterium]|nr:DUF1330 domain-containing protein [Candidatus Omnitrophota bacterium]HQO38428.1 DUF1330 domain-containing protein [Candidatus Omnitrophota bacterium]HQQ05900.1 DUF1330 domain-containing protein [Candidatus Omnitrophota bacterium]
MSAYVIINVDVKDQEQYAKYMKAGAPTILAHGGKPLVRGGKTEVWEGDPDPRRIIVLEFKDMQAARDWWDSSDYGEAKKLRLHAACADVFCVEGME